MFFYALTILSLWIVSSSLCSPSYSSDCLFFSLFMVFDRYCSLLRSRSSPAFNCLYRMQQFFSILFCLIVTTFVDFTGKFYEKVVEICMRSYIFYTYAFNFVIVSVSWICMWEFLMIFLMWLGTLLLLT